MRRVRVASAIGFAFLVVGICVWAGRLLPPRTAGVMIAAMSGFSALSSAFGFQILSIRREVRRTKGLDEERRDLLRRRLDRSVGTLFIRWTLSFTCGILGAAFGLVVRETRLSDGTWLLIASGLLLCLSSIVFLFLMIFEYRSLMRFATELEDRVDELEQKRAWAERAGKVAKR